MLARYQATVGVANHSGAAIVERQETDGLGTDAHHRSQHRGGTRAGGRCAAKASSALDCSAVTQIVFPPGVQQIPRLAEVFARIGSDSIRLAAFLVAGIVLFAVAALRTSGRPECARTAGYLKSAALLLATVDLFWTSIGSNPTARRKQVYPETKGIAYLREHVGHDRIFPVNQRWRPGWSA